MVTLDQLPADILHHLVQLCNKSDISSLRLTCSNLSLFLRSYMDKHLVSEICLGSHLHIHRAVATSAIHGRVMLDRLLKANAPIEQRDKNGETALHAAARLGNLNGVYRILEAGAAVDPVSSHEWTPLHLACRYGHANVARILLNFGADIDKSGSYGRTALDYAIQNGHRKCQKMLCKQGAHDTASSYCDGRFLIGEAKQQWGIYKLRLKE